MTTEKQSADAKKAKSKAKELSEETLDTVSGGLNPQPLPPRWGGKGF